jgi:hypothetical protein
MTKSMRQYELNTDFRLRLEAVLDSQFDKRGPVLRRNRKKAGRKFKDIKPIGMQISSKTADKDRGAALPEVFTGLEISLNNCTVTI